MLPMLGIGHSHLLAVKHAYDEEKNRRGAAPCDDDIAFLYLRDQKYEPNVVEEGGTERLNPQIRDMLDRHARSVGDRRLVFASIRGNQHHFLGMVNHPRPFDFFLAERPDLVPQKGAELVPIGLVETALRRGMAAVAQFFRQLRKEVAGPLWHLPTPPPIPDASYIADCKPFAEKIRQHGVAPASLRLKLWHLQQKLYREACAEHGIAYLDLPGVAADIDGFLVREAWHPDGVHGSLWYGRLLLTELAKKAKSLDSAV